MIGDLWRAALVGVAATVVIDLWNLFLKLAFDIPSLDNGLLGRWTLYMLDGRFRHASIKDATRRPMEVPVGWIVHYSIGVSLAVGLVLLAKGWLAAPTLWPALLYGIATIVMPLFVLQPALGFGVASSATAYPWKARLKSLGTHTAFGLGLYLGALLVNCVLPGAIQASAG